MTLEILKAKEELRNLIEDYAHLGDEKNIPEQMSLFTPDTVYKAYVGDFLAANVSGTENLGKEFSGHASQVKTYFTLNGQHTVNIDGDTASGVSYSQIKMIRASEGKDIAMDVQEFVGEVISVIEQDQYEKGIGQADGLVAQRDALFDILNP
jgi:hypothetical protein